MPTDALEWREVSLTRPLDPVIVAELLRRFASDKRSPLIVLETRLMPEATRYLFGARSVTADAVRSPFGGLPNATLRNQDGERQPVDAAGQLRASTRHRPLRLNDPVAVVRAILATGLRLGKGEQLVLQLVLGPRRVPLAVPNASPSSVVRPWWSVAWMGDGGQIDGEKRQALRAKVSDFGFACSIRLGVIAGTADRRRALMLGLLAAIRVSEAPGVQLRLHRESPHHLNQPTTPWFWPLRLGIPELVGLTAWPLGDDELPNMPKSHPRPLLPPPGTTGKTRIVADVAVPGSEQQLVLPIERAVYHTHLLGPTGSGKSTLLNGLLIQDIAAGGGAVFIEPKGDAIRDVLARIPKHRQQDVVVIDPTADRCIGVNPLHGAGRRADLVADNIVTIFKGLFGKSLGPRSTDILYAAVLTLARRDDTSLAHLPLLLTHDGVRRSLTAGIRDPLVLEPFWATFNGWTPAERAAAIAPLMNKARVFLRPGLRNVLGQRKPKFSLAQVFTERKLLFVPLNPGKIGQDAAGLLGSLIVAELWSAIQARASVPTTERYPVTIALDEAQNYLHLPTDIGEALVAARGYGAAFVLSHQHLSQLPKELLETVLANCRSRVAFQLQHRDARVLEQGHPELSAIDFESLGQYEVYASLFAKGRVSPYAFGRTRPLPPAFSDPAALMRSSAERYGQPLDEVEAGFLSLVDADIPDGPGPVGRRRRSTS